MTPEILTLILIFLLGLVIGSFLNVVIYRYNTGKSVGGRSRCLACRHQLRWYELLPVASFLIQGGRCRACRSVISWQYPLVEFLTAAAFVLVWRLDLPLGLTAIYFAIVACLVVIWAYDLRHQIIPDGFVYAFILLALAATIWRALGPTGFDWLLLGRHLAAGLGLATFFWLLWLISRGQWLGFADGKLALGVGFLAGPLGGLSAIVFAFWIGAVVGLLLLAWSRAWHRRHKSYTMKSELPFAPFIIAGLALVSFFNLNVALFF
jgi:prepilin signal peptidase PulO-like enzyme (type II secretory pathway)